MNKPPAFQLYADKFIAGTICMSHEERGLYILLLCIQWEKGYVTESEIKALGSAIAMPSLCHVIAKFQIRDGDKLMNRRLEEVRAELLEYRRKKAASGKAGAEKRWQRHSSAIAHPSVCQWQNDSSIPTSTNNTHTHTAEIPTWKEVEQAAQMIGVAPDSAKAFFDHHQGNQLWVNQHGKMIDWRHKLKSWGERDRQKPNPKAGAAPSGESIFAIKTKLEEVRKAKQRAKDKAAPDPLGGLQFRNEADKAEFKRLAALEKELAAQLTASPAVSTNAAA